MLITVISNPMIVNSEYRAYQPMHVLSARGHEIRDNRTEVPHLHMPSLLKSDVVLIHRYCDEAIQKTALRLRAAGVGVVWDNDDDISAVPRTSPLPAYRGLNRHRIITGIDAMLRIAHLVTTPSAVLAEKFQASGAKRVRVLENYVRDNLVSTGSRKNDRVVLGWHAGLEHQMDFQQLRLRETFERLLDAHPNLRIESIGFGLGLRSSRYRRTRQVTFLDLPRHLSQFDIGIAPIADLPFNRARSNLKLKEYAAAGVPWLASPIGPYVGHGEKQGGRLVSDGRWYQELERLIADPRDRRKLTKRAARWAKTQTIGRNAGLWEDALAEAIELACTSSGRRVVAN